MNFLSVQVAGVGPDGVRIASDASAMNAAAPLPVRCDAAAVGRRATLGIRPEHIHLRRASTGEVGFTARIESLEQLGATSFLYCVLSTGEKLTVQVAVGRLKAVVVRRLSCRSRRTAHTCSTKPTMGRHSNTELNE